MNSFLRIVVSLLITAGIGLCIASFFDNFWPVFTLVVLFQFIAFYFINTSYSNRLVIALETERIQAIKEANRNTVLASCPCDEQHSQTIDFRFDSENINKCTKCGNNFKTTAAIKSVLVTDPIMFEK